MSNFQNLTQYIENCSTQQQKGFKWASEVKFLEDDPGTPWKRYQWDIARVPVVRSSFNDEDM